MSEKPDELTKLSAIAADMGLATELRIKAIEQLGRMDTHETLLILLDIAANEKLNVTERDLALKKAREVLKRTSPY